MLLDLSSDRWLEALVGEYGRSGLQSRRRLGHAWRHLLAADRLPAGSVKMQATDLIRANLHTTAVDLVPGEKVRLWPIEPELWCQAVALAIDEGLAYGGPYHSIRRKPKLADFARRLMAACEPVDCFISSQSLSSSGSGWAPLTAHTFDFVAVAASPKRLAVLFVVDED
jgi:hypothetical protein